MQVIGFNLNKINAEKSKDFKRGSINTNVEFLNIEKDEVEMLKDKDVLKIDFRFIVSYKVEEKSEKEDELKEESKKDQKEEIKEKLKPVKNLAEVNFEGSILVTVTAEESKETLKSWKNKETSKNLKTSLFNIILKRCSIKALTIEDELGLPPHIPLPRINNK